MATERCTICDQTLPFSETVHLLIHTNTEAGVVDYYVCRSCYEDHIASLFDESAEE